MQFGAVGTRSDGAPAPSGEHLKETRLGSQATLPQAFPNTAKDPRLPDAMQQTYTTRPEQYYQARPQQTSLFARLNWKHYAGAGAALLALLIVPFAMIAGLNRNHAAAPPVEQISPEPAQSEQSPAPSDPQNQITPLPSASGEEPTDPASPGGSRRPRDNSSDRAEPPANYAETAPPPTAAPPQPAPPPKSEASTPPKEEKKEVAKKEEEKKEDKKKEEKKKGGFGGFLKKVFGGDEKKEEKKKKP